MEKKEFFEKDLFNANVEALNELVDSAKVLAEYWNQINATPLTVELYGQWLENRNLIYENFRAEKLKTIGKFIFDALPENSQRPPMDTDRKLNGRFERFFGTATHYTQPLRGTHRGRIFVNTGFISWLGGEPLISDQTIKKIKKRCTWQITGQQEPLFQAIETYCTSYNLLQTQIKKNFQHINWLDKIPVKYSSGIATPDMGMVIELFQWQK